MSGSGGDLGYDYQANVTAYIAAHALAGQPLGWFDTHIDLPAAWRAETKGPGDDLSVETIAKDTIEIQVKHALQRGEEFDRTFRKLIAGLQNDEHLRAALIVDRAASRIIT